MKRFLRILGKVFLYLLLVIVGLVVAGIAFLFIAFPRDIPAAEITIERTPERVERGRYLVEHVGMCLNCHSERDWRYYSGPVDPAAKGGGTHVTLYGEPTANSGNITPFGIGEWSDGEVVRAITSGLKADGRAVHPLMPFDTYTHFAEDDVHAIVAYLRTLDPVERVPEKNSSLLMNLVGRTLPKEWEPPPPVDRSDTVAYGEYLVRISECRSCHYQSSAGGRQFDVPSGGVVAASNLTPHPTGIGNLSRDNFVGRFKAFASPSAQRIPVPADQVGTVMPWAQYAGMTEDDLGAIYDYLMTLPPVDRTVIKVVSSPSGRTDAPAMEIPGFEPPQNGAGEEAAPEGIETSPAEPADEDAEAPPPDGSGAAGSASR